MPVTATNGASFDGYVERSSDASGTSDAEVFAQRDRLYSLIVNGDVSGIRGLFSENPPKEVMDELTNTALRYVITHCKGVRANAAIDVLKTLLDYLPYEALMTFDAAGMNPLMYTAQEGRADMTRVLLDAGASQVPVNHHGWTALFYAAISDAVDVIKALLGYESFKGIDARDDDGNTAFAIAVGHRNHAAAEVLLKHGANINAKNDLGETALMRSVTGVANRKKMADGDASLVQWLIDKQARLNETDKNGRTALHHAVLSKNVTAARALLQAGASYTIKDGDGKDVMSLAKSQGGEMESIFSQHIPSH